METLDLRISDRHTQSLIINKALHLGLDLQLSVLTKFEEHVCMPTFVAAFCEAYHQRNALSHYREHYASQIALWVSWIVLGIIGLDTLVITIDRG